MTADSKPKVTCYSEGEGAFMRQSQEFRGRVLKPLLVILVRLRITPDHLTFLSLVAGLLFCPLFLWKPIAAFACLLAHVLLDGLDGPLARFAGGASNRGSFTDTMVDQVVVTFSMVTMIHSGCAAVWPGALYIFFYGTVVLFAMARNALAIPYSWLVRPRFFIYAWMPVEVYFWRGSLNWLLWIMSFLLAIKMLTGFVQIRRRM